MRPWWKQIAKMKISSEVKVGVIGIVTLLVLIWGINYLKGKNILGSSYALHAFYDDAGGLENSASVLMNGVKVGYVESLELRPEQKPAIHLVLHIERAYPLRNGSIASLVSADLMGTRAIRIDPAEQGEYLEDQDSIASLIEADLFASLEEQIMPVMHKIGELAVTLDTLAVKLDTLATSDAARSSLQNLSEISESLKASLGGGGSLYESFQSLQSVTAMLEEQEDEIAATTVHLRSITEALDSAGVERIAEELALASSSFRQIMEQLASGEGSAGKLLYSDTLYMNLQHLVTDLDSLITDLNKNPGDYVRFSLFGKSQK